MISVEADIAKAQEALSGTSKSLAAIERKTLSIIAKGTVKAVKGGIRQTLKSRTGELLKAFRYKVHKNGVANVYPDGESGSAIFPKAYVLNYGYTGPTKRAINKPHSFVQVGELYAASDSYMQDVRKMIDKELEKYWGK